MDEIARIARENGGKSPGIQRFERATGIRESDWYPHHWLRWGDALREAGLSANNWTEATPEHLVVEKYIALVRRLDRLPIQGELIRESKADPLFPSLHVFRRLGGNAGILAATLRYAEGHDGFEDIVAICVAAGSRSGSRKNAKPSSSSSSAIGAVYLMKSGRHYKIGRTNSVGRREWELGIKIPIPQTTIHKIDTDDPIGIEAYWHKRFAEKRGQGEWFDLSPDDLIAFKRWKRIV